MIETANHSRELLGPAARFLVRNKDKIERLGGSAMDVARGLM
jgi:hypothetical protein